MNKTFSDELPQFGMAGVSIAGIFVCASITSTNKVEIYEAIWYFSMSLPVIISSVVLKMLSSTYKQSIRDISKIVINIVKMLGDGLSVIGLYHVIRHVSPEASDVFQLTALVVYILTAYLVSGFSKRNPKRRRSTT
ncbi:hypothetical protein [Vibrio campbellii]|uniref:hypothetical protein n=1 Tax=Vibrio campbellii TaxID=680 RepID=UPI000CD352BB|nr:hypothetical protein [Vibrio campbellii]AUV85911.1 hypothetical protein C1N50_06980 [Vibrio campbellii]